MAQGLRAFKDKRHNDPIFTLETGLSVPVFFLREPWQALWVVEHRSPFDWRKSCLCTADEQCYGCERYRYEPFSGWAQKPRFYIDVVSGKIQMPMVMSQSLTNSGLTIDLLRYYNEHGTIRNTWFAVSKTGNGKKTKWHLAPLDLNREPVQKNILSLHKQITNIPYEAQETYLTN